MFAELEQGAPRTNALSPKLRRTNEGAVPPGSPPASSTSTPARTGQSSSSTSDFAEQIRQLGGQTRAVGRFVKLAFPDLADPDIETERRDLLPNQESMR